jgi:predicted amidohydrolase
MTRNDGHSSAGRHGALLAVIIAAIPACAVPPQPLEPVKGDTPSRPFIETFQENDPADGVLVAAVQAASDLGRVDGNRNRLAALVERAASRGAKIIVLPECAVPGYRSQDGETDWVSPEKAAEYPDHRTLKGIAEAVPGPSTDFFAALSKKHGIYITVPLIEAAVQGDATKYFNTLVLVGPDGRITAHYRKLNPWWPAESYWASRGDRGLVIADTEYGRLGLMICFDVHTVLAKMSAQKADIILYSIAWVSIGDPDWWYDEELPDRVRKAGCHMIAANWSVDRAPEWHGYGYSQVISKDGSVLNRARTKTGDEIVYARLPGKKG